MTGPELRLCGPVSISAVVQLFPHLMFTPCHYHLLFQPFPPVHTSFRKPLHIAVASSLSVVCCVFSLLWFSSLVSSRSSLSTTSSWFVTMYIVIRSPFPLFSQCWQFSLSLGLFAFHCSLCIFLFFLVSLYYRWIDLNNFLYHVTCHSYTPEMLLVPVPSFLALHMSPPPPWPSISYHCSHFPSFKVVFRPLLLFDLSPLMFSIFRIEFLCGTLSGVLFFKSKSLQTGQLLLACHTHSSRVKAQSGGHIWSRFLKIKLSCLIRISPWCFVL